MAHQSPHEKPLPHARSPRELFGQLAIRKGYITPEQLDQALARQKQIVAEGAKHKLIGLLMVEMGFLTNGQLIAILKNIESARGENVE